MKNKDLKQLIKSKANEVEIKNLSAQIIEKAKQLPVKPAVIEKRPFVFRLKPVFAASLAIMVTIALALFYTPTVNQDAFELSAYDQALVTSSMSMVFAYDIEDDEELSMTGLSASAFEGPYIIDDEIQNLNRYILWMESFFASNQTFNQTVMDVSDTQYLRHLTFDTQTFSGHANFYELIIYNTVENTDTDKIFYGHIGIEDDIYPITIIFNKGNSDTFEISTEFENNYDIRIHYTKSQQEDLYNIKLNKNAIPVSQVEIKKTVGNNVINLHFILGRVNGTYQFEQGENQSMIARYAIIKNSQMERGSIGIEVAARDNLPDIYELTIHPFGESPYQAQKEREATPHRPRPKAGPFASLI